MASHGALFRLVHHDSFATIRLFDFFSVSEIRRIRPSHIKGSVNYLDCAIVGRQRPELQQVLRIRSDRQLRALSGF